MLLFLVIILVETASGDRMQVKSALLLPRSFSMRATVSYLRRTGSEYLRAALSSLSDVMQSQEFELEHQIRAVMNCFRRLVKNICETALAAPVLRLLPSFFLS